MNKWLKWIKISFERFPAGWHECPWTNSLRKGKRWTENLRFIFIPFLLLFYYLFETKIQKIKHNVLSIIRNSAWYVVLLCKEINNEDNNDDDEDTNIKVFLFPKEHSTCENISQFESSSFNGGKSFLSDSHPQFSTAILHSPTLFYLLYLKDKFSCIFILLNFVYIRYDTRYDMRNFFSLDLLFSHSFFTLYLFFLFLCS